MTVPALTQMTERQKAWALGGAGALIVALVFILVPPMAQDAAYHHFSDLRGWWGIANFGDVVSNGAFFAAGLYGLWGLRRRRAETVYIPLTVYFVGVMLVAPGSAYYHWAPDNATLFWDRLPMAVAFMGVFSAVIAERVDAKIGVRYMLPVLVVLGLASVLYWRQSELAGVGDLRAYALVQFLPMIMIPALMGMFASDRATIGWRAIGAAFVFYALAKVAEYFDAQVLQLLGGVVSGHTLKHVLAAMSAVALGMNLRR